MVVLLSTGEAEAEACLPLGWVAGLLAVVLGRSGGDFSRHCDAGTMDSEAAVTNCSKLIGAVAFVSEIDRSCFVDHCNRCWYPGHSNPFCAQFLQPGFVSSQRSCRFHQKTMQSVSFYITQYLRQWVFDLEVM